MSEKETLVHESAIVDQPCDLGRGTNVWHNSHIREGVSIGKNCNIGMNVYIDRNVKIGDLCKVQNNVSIYEGVILEDEVFCGPSCVFTNVINPRAAVSRKHEFKETRIKRGATIGANATIVCGLTIGRWCLIGAGALVRENLPDFSLAVGVPARRIGWVGVRGETLPNLLVGEIYTCPVTGIRYQLESVSKLTMLTPESEVRYE